jgi:hypothetical protein
MATFLPMGRFLNPVFIRCGSHALNGWTAILSFDRSLLSGIPIPFLVNEPSWVRVLIR